MNGYQLSLYTPFLLPFLISGVSAAAGCLALRLLARVGYAWLSVFWLMAAFAFTFAGRIFLLDVLPSLAGIATLAVISALAPLASFVGYRRHLDPGADDRPWHRAFFALLLMGASTVSAFNSGRLLSSIADLQAVPASPWQSVVVLSAIVILGVVGLLTILFPDSPTRPSR